MAVGDPSAQLPVAPSRSTCTGAAPFGGKVCFIESTMSPTLRWSTGRSPVSEVELSWVGTVKTRWSTSSAVIRAQWAGPSVKPNERAVTRSNEEPWASRWRGSVPTGSRMATAAASTVLRPCEVSRVK